ncbi:MAG TPA: hypothetical protein VE326_11610 [Candidatus Binatia bacterium]|nr:hypothetical protein [Candidatus Binatia bacterium]
MLSEYRWIEALKVVRGERGRQIHVKPRGAVDFELFPYYTKDGVVSVEPARDGDPDAGCFVTVRLFVFGPVELLSE